jgi:hypothetical protein
MDRRQFFGDSVSGTLIRLVLLSIVVGVVFSALGINPSNIVYHFQVLVQRLYDLGFGTIQGAITYFLLGAIVVFPVWFIVRLLKAAKPDDRRP